MKAYASRPQEILVDLKVPIVFRFLVSDELEAPRPPPLFSLFLAGGDIVLDVKQIVGLFEKLT